MKSNSLSMHEACLLCGHAGLRQRYVLNGFHLVQCKACAFLFVAEKVPSEVLAAYYTEEDAFVYDDVHNRKNLEFYYRYLWAYIRQRYLSGRILDVGCSSGYFLDGMSGWECHGIEMDVRRAAFAAQRHGARIFSGDLAAYPGAKDYFDVISLQDVLDHLPDPRSAVAKCREMLKPGGLIIVKVHDVGSLYARLVGKSYYALVPPIHLLYFNRANLLNMLATSGFHVSGWKYIAHMMFLKTVFFRLSQKDRDGFFYRLYERMAASWIGHLRLKKNLYDIMTVFAVKQ